MLAVLRLHPCSDHWHRAALAHRHFIEAAADAVPVAMGTLAVVLGVWMWRRKK